MTNPLDIQISCFRNATDTTPKTVNLLTWLTSAKYKPLVDQIRATKSKAEKTELKKQLPAITPSGLFEIRSKSRLITPSGLIAFDIDFEGNEHITNYAELKDQLKNIQNIAYCGLSVSGNGFWGLIPIKYPNQHESHFKALQIAFSKYGIKLDPACKDVCRLRFYSYDDNAYFNPNAKTFTGLFVEPKTTYQPTNYTPTTNGSRPIEIAVKIIREAPDGQKWECLNRASYLAGGYVGSGAITETEARHALQSAIRAKPNVSDLQAAFKTIDAGLKDGQSRPIYQPVNTYTPTQKSAPLPTNNDFLKQATNNGLQLTAAEVKDFINFCDTLN